MQINDFFYLLEKKILIMDGHEGVCDASKRQFALSGVSIIGPVASVKDVSRAVSFHEPDAVIIDIRADDCDIVEIADRLYNLKIPFVFAAISTNKRDFVREGFNLNGDVAELRKITRALFLNPVGDVIP
ncbi:hypothetical protein [Agrobacterium larrymoorei]|uniref:DNA-binding NtrC family response regulator n=1 Tax=Agrobacterium larrymoorei TaxID=160699 RepID=A0ABU0UHC4_9HYPH|nr:hypothetical protein [Agrobacterium larrymoorei]MDQ1184324.1 DNA-binding NtrC family response regulator [Agrobacterium larrymoorei]